MRSFVLHALLAVSIALGALGSHERLASAQSSAPNEHARRRAKDLYEAGVKHYNVLEYDQAIDSFKQAYLLFPTAGSLYNIAQSYRKKGTAFCTSAANFYRSYLRERADAPDRPDVEARIADAERCAASNPQSREVDATTAPRTSAPASATPERAPAPAPDSQEHLAHRSTLPLWIAGAGAVVLVAGGVLYGVALAKHGSLEDECSARNCPPDRWQLRLGCCRHRNRSGRPHLVFRATARFHERNDGRDRGHARGGHRPRPLFLAGGSITRTNWPRVPSTRREP